MHYNRAAKNRSRAISNAMTGVPEGCKLMDVVATTMVIDFVGLVGQVT